MKFNVGDLIGAEEPTGKRENWSGVILDIEWDEEEKDHIVVYHMTSEKVKGGRQKEVTMNSLERWMKVNNDISFHHSVKGEEG